MKRLISFLGVLLLAVLLASCMATGDMIAPDDLFESSIAPSTKTPETGNQATQTPETDQGTPPQTEPPVKDEKKVIKFVGVGDALIHSAIYWEAETIASSMNGYTKKYYFKDMYEHIADKIKGADIAFVNHEAPIANTAIAGYPHFNAPEESGDALVELGFNVVNIANNHMFDSDGKTTGYADTIDYWATKDVLQIGGYKNQADYDKPRIMSIDGVDIAFLAYTYSANGLSINPSSAAAGYITPIYNDSTLIKHIKTARASADLVFVSMHWDWSSENNHAATSEQKRLAKLIADQGADVIIGHHSHTVQPVEWITGATGKKTLCIYSLGNLISGMLYPQTTVGGMMTFDIVKDKDRITIENPVYNPTVCHFEIDNFNVKAADGYPKRTGFKVYMLEDYSQALAAKHGVRFYGALSYDIMKGFVTNYVPAEFRPDFLK